ncbi:MAG: hypothetical protein ACOH1R_00750 [Luteimonas sp.]
MKDDLIKEDLIGSTLQDGGADIVDDAGDARGHHRRHRALGVRGNGIACPNGSHALGQLKRDGKPRLAVCHGSPPSRGHGTRSRIMEYIFHNMQVS